MSRPGRDSPALTVERLASLTRHRHALPVMAELHRGRGAKLVTLVNRTGGSRAAVKQALDHLASEGWVRRPAGHGHPLRPEYELTPEGEALGAPCAALETWLRRTGQADALLRRWALPAVAALAEGATRFSELARRLGGITDRALSLALASLVEAGLVTRVVEDGHPPSVRYRVAPGARPLLSLLGRA